MSSEKIRSENVERFFLRNGMSLASIREDYDYNIVGLKADMTNPTLDQYILEILSTNFQNKVNMFIPGRAFKSLSVTGTSCDLHCEHCDNKYLEIMEDVSSEEKFRAVLDKLVDKNAQGCLISGGCDAEGKVPVLQFFDVLKEYRETTDLIFNYHTGLLDDEEIDRLVGLKPHLVSFDFTVDEEIIKNVYHHEKKEPSDYIRVLESLISRGINVVPHITLGLNFGRINKEFAALELLKQYNFDLLVFIVIIPPDSSGQFSVPDSKQIRNVFLTARLLFPETEISLGCMRPRGKQYQFIENAAVEAGFNRYVIPSKLTQRAFKKRHLSVETYEACCAIPLRHYNALKEK